MKRLIDFLKHNWALIILVIIAVKYFFGGIATPLIQNSSFRSLSSTSMPSFAPAAGIGEMAYTKDMAYNPVSSYAPTTSQSRIVLKDTSLSLQVDNVSDKINQIENLAGKLGGFMVDSSLSTPEGASSGSITIRVPADRRSEALMAFRKMAVKVVSENVIGQDVTDQYVDAEARLKVLNDTKSKFEDILKSAVNVNDLLNVQRELINLQSQIDSLKGQQEYLKKSADLTRITIYLSTDDLSLPYTPDQAWRPAAIFKQAVRSLVANVRSLGAVIIWLIVYSPIIIVVIGLIWFLKRRGLFK